MSDARLTALLDDIIELLQQHPGDEAVWLVATRHLLAEDEPAALRRLNSARMWGGAGSVANQAMADNPGLDDWSWQMHIREFRERMIELGEWLREQGETYPDIGTWIMAFNSWNQSER